MHYEVLPTKEEQQIQEEPTPKTPSIEEAGVSPKNNLPLHLSITKSDIPEGTYSKLSHQEHKDHLTQIAKINKELYELSKGSIFYRELLYSIYQDITKLHNEKHALQAALLSPIPKVTIREGKRYKSVQEQIASELFAQINRHVEKILSEKEQRKEDLENG